MFSEKSKLVERKEEPYYGGPQENRSMEEAHWKNKRKKRQLTMVVIVMTVLVALGIGILLAITFPFSSDETREPEDPQDILGPSRSVLTRYSKAGVSSDSEICSNIGRMVLQEYGGSAVDAAVAVTLCIGVINPHSSGIGGGLFMMIYDGNTMHAINGRETAPVGVNPDMYDRIASVSGGSVVGVPGEVAGLWEAHQKFGKVPWSDLVIFSRDLALEGFAVSGELAHMMQKYKNKLKADPVLRSEFINAATNEPWLEGELLVRQRLGATLELLAAEGVEGFYNGTIAAHILEDIESSNGIITAEDLSTYRARVEQPISYSVTGNLTMYTLPFPSSGPVVSLALGILDGFGRKRHDDMTAKDIGEDIHQLAETLKYAASYRAHVADPHFSNITEIQDRLLSREFAAQLRNEMEDYKTQSDPRQYGGKFSLSLDADAGTAHVSIIGPDGDAVALTSTINLAFGARFMGNATGIIFNSELNDFSHGTKADKFGLRLNPNNRIGAGKRPASSMAPLIFLNSSNQPVYATGGGSGGLNIIPAVVSTTWRALYRYMDIKEAIDYPRISPNFYTSRLNYEYGLPKSIVEELKRRGHAVHRISDTVESPDEYIGSVCSVCRTKQDGIILANADFRRNGQPGGF